MDTDVHDSDVEVPEQPLPSHPTDADTNLDALLPGAVQYPTGADSSSSSMPSAPEQAWSIDKWLNTLSAATSIPAEVIEKTIQQGWAKGLRPVRAVLHLGLVNENQLRDAINLIKQAVSLAPETIDWNAASQVPPELCQRLGVLPYQWVDSVLLIAHHTRLTTQQEQELLSNLDGAEYELVFADRYNIESCLLARPQNVGGGIQETASEQRNPAQNWQVLTGATGDEQDEIVNLNIQSLLSKAVLLGASDISIAYDREAGAEPVVIAKIRHLGQQREIDRWQPALGLRIINRFRVVGDVAFNAFALADGRFTMDYPAGDEEYTMRLSFVPTDGGAGTMLSVRMLSSASGETQTLDDLWPSQFSTMAADIRNLIRDRPDGIILVAGRTGDGKSTTLAAMLREVADGRRKVTTVENPIEYHIPGAQQVQVVEWHRQDSPPPQHLTFANILRSLLRSDPDVIMIGEIRDSDTAKIAVDAAQTGHTVFSTVHVRDAAAAAARLLDLAPGMESSLADSLNGIIAQRLLRTLCEVCHGDNPSCKRCNGERWTGRTAAGELLVVDDAVRDAISLPGAPQRDVREASTSVGPVPHLTRLVLGQVTTLEEVQRVFGGTVAAAVDAEYRTAMVEQQQKSVVQHRRSL